MRWNKWLGIVAALLQIISCFMTWVVISSKNIVVTGVDASGTSFGRPGYFNLLFAGIFILFHFIPRVWAKRGNLAVAALNMAWALRNYFLITTCRGGDCPEKHWGIWLLLISSVLLLVSALFPDIKLKEKPGKL